MIHRKDAASKTRCRLQHRATYGSLQRQMYGLPGALSNDLIGDAMHEPMTNAMAALLRITPYQEMPS